MILPSFFICFFLAIYGGSVLFFEQYTETSFSSYIELGKPESIILHMFEMFPAAYFMQFLICLTVFICFITAADSNLEATSNICLQSDRQVPFSKQLVLKIFFGLAIGVAAWGMVVFTGVNGMRIVNFLAGLPALLLLLFAALFLLCINIKAVLNYKK